MTPAGIVFYTSIVWLVICALVAYLAYGVGSHNAMARLVRERREQLRRDLAKAWPETLPKYVERRSMQRPINGMAEVAQLRAAQREGGGDR